MKTPLDSNNRLSKLDGPEVVDPLVNMTRPELDF